MKQNRKLHCNPSKTNVERGIKILKIGSAPKTKRIHLRINKKTRPVATNNFFAQLKDIPMENAEPSNEEGSSKISGAGEDLNTGRSPPSF
jgi:hypothetical protein